MATQPIQLRQLRTVGGMKGWFALLIALVVPPATAFGANYKIYVDFTFRTYKNKYSTVLTVMECCSLQRVLSLCTCM